MIKNMKIEKPKAVIFDWDNTLVDTWPLIASALNHTLTQMNKEPWSMERVKQDITKSMRDSFPEMFGDDWQKAGKIYQESYRSMQLTELGFIPFAYDFIEKLHAKNILLFVISNKIGATLRVEVKHLGLEDKFFSIIGAHDADFDKPFRHPVDLALIGSDLDPTKDHIWFIGDTIVDVECAYNSGCHPIIYGEAKGISQDLIANGKNDQGQIPVFPDYQQFIAFVDKLYQA